LAIQDLARDLGVSTMPVREALITLANEGLVDTLPRRGFRVGIIRDRDISHTFLVHGFVSGLLAEEAARSITAADLETLRALNDDFDTVSKQKSRGIQRSSRLEEINFEFHRTINWSSDSPRLRWFLRAGSNQIPRLPRHSYPDIHGWIEAAQKDHPAIIAALERHDGAAARKLAEHHVRQAGDLILLDLAARRDPKARRAAAGQRRSS
jgi:DNA-binding GntR family transcriptional regulator